jgi:cysteine desulfurase
VLTHGNVRVSLPRGTRADEVDAFLAALPDLVRRIRQDAGVA